MRGMSKLALGSALAVGLLASTLPADKAEAKSHIDVGIAFGFGAPQYIEPAPPVYFEPAPVYAVPPATYYYPAPIVVAPPPPPVYYGPRYYPRYYYAPRVYARPVYGG
jgi:hypothetical protein